MKTTSVCDSEGFQSAFSRKKLISLGCLAELLKGNCILLPESLLWFEIDSASFFPHQKYFSSVVLYHLLS